MPRVAQQVTVRASTRSKGSVTTGSGFSAPNRKALAPALERVTISSCHSEEPPGKIPTLGDQQEQVQPGAAQTGVSGVASSELIPLPAVSTRGFGAEGSIWPGGGAWQPPRTAGRRRARRPRPTPPPAALCASPRLDPDATGREGAKVQPDAVQGEGVVASGAAAEPKSVVEADAAALTSSSEAPQPREDSRHACRPPNPPS